MIMKALQPGVPGRVHPAQVVGAAGRRHQLAHLALRPVEGAEAGEPRRDGRHRCDGCNVMQPKENFPTSAWHHKAEADRLTYCKTCAKMHTEILDKKNNCEAGC